MPSSISKDSVTLMLGRSLAFVISLLAPLFLVRFFSVSEYGEYRQIMLLIVSATPILAFGMKVSLFYFFPHYPEEKDIYLSRTIAIISMTSITFLLLLCIFNNNIAVFFGNVNFIYYSPLIGIATLFLSLSLIIETVTIVDKNVLLSAKILTASRLARAVIVITTAFYWGVSALLCGLIFLFLVKTILSFWYFINKYKINFKKIQFYRSADHFKYAIPFALGGIFSMLVEHSDKYILSHFFGPELFAIYTIGFYQSPFNTIVFQSIGDVILPRIVELKAKNNIKGIVKLWHVAIEKSFLLGFPLFMFCFVFSDDIILTLFTEKYIAAIPIFRIASIIILLQSTRYGIMSRAFAKTWFSFGASFVSFAVMLPLCIFAIQKFGVIGAAWAVIIGKVINVVSELLFAKYLLSLGWSNFFPFIKTGLIGLLSIFCVLPVYLLAPYLQNFNQWIKIITIFSIFVTSYIYCTNHLKLWNTDALPISDKQKNYLKKVFLI